MRKLLVTTALMLILSLGMPLRAEVFEGKVYPANNRDYRNLLLPRLREAKKSVYMIMFLASYYPDYKETSPTNLFLEELIKAHARGVKVEIILDQSDSNYDSHSATENFRTALYLSGNGITTYFDSPEKTTHAKLIVIDGKTVVIGSANWSYSAMSRNNETTVIIESPELAAYYTGYFEDLKKSCGSAVHPTDR